MDPSAGVQMPALPAPESLFQLYTTNRLLDLSMPSVKKNVKNFHNKGMLVVVSIVNIVGRYILGRYI